MLVLCVSLVLTTSGSTSGASITDANAFIQQQIVPLPLDRTRIYFVDKNESLAPLSFETGTTPLDPNATAKNTRLGYVEVKGEHAAINITDSNPRFYLFVPDTPNVHPPFLVRLTTKKRGVRRVVVTTERGQQGFAYESGQIVRPLYTVQAHDNGMYFMEVRGREPLLPGEYAFIGADLARLATFRVEAESSRSLAVNP
jgi:hypothetical protein